MLFLVGQVLAYSTKVQAWLAKRFLWLCHSGQYFLDVHFGQQRPLEGCSGGRRVVLARGCPRPVGKVP